MMDSISAAQISKALDGLALRQVFLAQNIANAGAENYTAMTVSFEAELLAASLQETNLISAVESVEPRLQIIPADESGSSELRLDMQLAESSKTALRYSALVDIMGRQMSLARSAITSGQG